MKRRASRFNARAQRRDVAKRWPSAKTFAPLRACSRFIGVGGSCRDEVKRRWACRVVAKRRRMGLNCRMRRAARWSPSFSLSEHTLKRELQHGRCVERGGGLNVLRLVLRTQATLRVEERKRWQAQSVRTSENGPPFQRWERRATTRPSPVRGGRNLRRILSSLTGLVAGSRPKPSDESLGYCRSP